MSLYDFAVSLPSQMLQNLQEWIAEARTFAEAKETSVDDYVGFRMTPDMRPFSFQVQAACDAAKFGASRLANVDPPKHADDETTMEQLEARIASVLEYLSSFEPAQFEDAADRLLTPGFIPEGKAVRGEDYLREFSLPNFHFHIVTAYGLLRMSGVRLGKRKYIRQMTLQDA